MPFLFVSKLPRDTVREPRKMSRPFVAERLDTHACRHAVGSLSLSRDFTETAVSSRDLLPITSWGKIGGTRHMQTMTPEQRSHAARKAAQAAGISARRPVHGQKGGVMILRYQSGEEIKKGDRVLFHREPGRIELVAVELSGDPETDWLVQEHGGGVMILDDSVVGRTFIPAGQLDECEDLEFVSRPDAP